jgi:anaerobic carbon-monoxide dehydrogenase iron sulfur subunit
MKFIWVDRERCVSCKSCEIACAVNRSSLSRRLPEAIYEAIAPLSRVRVEALGTEKGFPLQCRHCEDAPCLDACPAGALFRDLEGLVLVHDERCIGCWMCIMVCPFGAPQPFREFRKVIKCDRCAGMEAPACVESCPTHALILADSEQLVAEGLKPLKKGGWIRLDFISDKGRLKSS